MVSEAPEAPVVVPGHDSASVTSKIRGVVLRRPVHNGWIAGFLVAFCILMLFNFCIAWLFLKGVGIWGVNIPVAWGFAITNFVWWIGIGHAGTFISAILLLLHQDWRTSINRFAEAMTLFAVACAGTFPLLHLGRPWVFYWLIPYPDTMGLWPQWRSALVWDVFAVSTYLLVSLMFWYIGLIPDVATMRDRAEGKPTQLIYGILALGWRGSARHWKRFHMVYLLLAGLATPLVLSVHSVVSLDFAIAIVPGWHSTIFPPYFVAGAIFSGFAMVLTLAIPIRTFYWLQDFITIRHLENSAKVMLATGLMFAPAYITAGSMSWYSDDNFAAYRPLTRHIGGARAVPAREREAADRADRAHARQGLQLIDDSLIKLRLPFRRDRGGQPDVKNKQMPGIEPGVDRGQPQETFHHQTGADEEDERDRDLGHGQTRAGEVFA